MSDHSPATEGNATSPQPSRVLVADDDVDVLDLLRLRLEAAGYEVVTANDGVAGLAAALEQRPALAVLDVTMPGLDGLELTRRLRATPATANLPIVLLTARTQEDDIARGYAAGAEAYVPKPFRANELVALVGVLLSRSARPAAAHEPSLLPLDSPLTQRQLEILRLLSDGVRTPEIAERLGIQAVTAENHIQRTLTRLGVRSRLEAVAQARRRGLI